MRFPHFMIFRYMFLKTSLWSLVPVFYIALFTFDNYHNFHDFFMMMLTLYLLIWLFVGGLTCFVSFYMLFPVVLVFIILKLIAASYS